MATSIPTLTSFTASTTAVSSQVNANFTAIRDTVNEDVLWLTKTGQTMTQAMTWSAMQTFSVGLTVTASGLTVSAGGVTVTGDSTITGTLGGVTTLTCTTVTATNIGGTLSTAAQANVTSVGTLTALVVAGAVTVTTAKTTLAATAAGYASLNLPNGTAPSSPAAGDIWSTTGGFFGYTGGATGQFLTTGVVRPGVYGNQAGGSLQTTALTDSTWSNPLATYSTYTQTGTNPPTLDATETVFTINETGWYTVWGRLEITVGSPTAIALGWAKVSGTGSPGDPSTGAANWTGTYPDNSLGLCHTFYAETGSTWNFAGYTGTAGVTVQIRSYSLVRVA